MYIPQVYFLIPFLFSKLRKTVISYLSLDHLFQVILLLPSIVQIAQFFLCAKTDRLFSDTFQIPEFIFFLHKHMKMTDSEALKSIFFKNTCKRYFGKCCHSEFFRPNFLIQQSIKVP